ncbi:MAG: protein kinase domain-containing protein [Blastocatellia bacterium]
MTKRYREFEGDDWLGRSLKIGAHKFSMVTENIVAAGGDQPFRRMGKKAKVFKLKEKSGYFALKVFFKKYAVAENAISTLQLVQYAKVPGLKVCQREMVYDTDAYNINEPGLEFAILMPWISGKAWAEIVTNREDLPERECIALAREMATVLKGLEDRGLTHADISSNNVFVEPGLSPRLELIDVEDMYGKGFFHPEEAPAGTPGYNHPPSSEESYWNPYGDRFAGAVILAEMLTWHQPGIRSQSVENSYFHKNEMCNSNHPKYETMIAALREHSKEVAALFTRAWESMKLSDCPSLGEWRSALQNVKPASTKIRAAGLAGLAKRSFLDLALESPPALQTRFVSSITCFECGARVRAITPTDHANTCSQHPDNFKPALGKDWLTQNPLLSSKLGDHTKSLLEGILGEKDPTCDECGKQIKFGMSHELTCSKHPFYVPEPKLLDPPNTRITRRSPQFHTLSNPIFDTCDECSELIWKDNDKGHKETCSKHPDYKPPSLLRLSRPSTLPNLSYDTCDECGYLIFDGDDRNHKITCSKHPDYKRPGASRFSDVSFAPIEDAETGGDDPKPNIAFGLSGSNICGECYMTIRRVGSIELGHLHRCSKRR